VSNTDTAFWGFVRVFSLFPIIGDENLSKDPSFATVDQTLIEGFVQRLQISKAMFQIDNGNDKNITEIQTLHILLEPC
jgi:hypothetical protein